MTQDANLPETNSIAVAEPAELPKRSILGTALRLAVWAALALGLSAGVHFANIANIQGFPLGFYFAAQGIPIALVVMAFWWTRRAGIPQAGLLPAGAQMAGAAEAAAIIASPAIILLVAGELFHAGYDGLSTTLGIVAGLVLAILVFSDVGWAGRPRPAARAPGGSNLLAGFGPPAGLVAFILAFSLIPLIAAHLVLAFDLMGSLFQSAGRTADPATGATGGAARVEIMAALTLAVCILAALPFAGFATALMVSALIGLMIAAAALAVLLAVGMPDNPFPVPQISYGLALDQIRSLERALILDGLADPAAMHQHARPFTSWSALNFSAFLLSAIFGTAAIAGFLLTSTNLAAASKAAEHGRASPQTASAPRAAVTARALAWSSLIVLIVMVTLPAVPAFTKYEFYRSIAQGITLDARPDWLIAADSAGVLRVCPPSDTLALPADGQTSDAAGESAAPGDPALAGIDQSTLEATAGRSSGGEAGDGNGGRSEAALDVYACVGPAPRLAVGDLAVSQDRDVEFFAAVAGIDAPGMLAVTAGMLAALLAGAVGLSRLAVGGIASLRQPAGRSTGNTAIAAIVIASAAGLLAHSWQQAPAIDLAKVSLCLLAAVLFPALAVYAARPSASPASLAIAALTGAAITAYYILATTYWPQEFAMQWQAVSSAPEWKYEELIRLADACQDGDQSSCSAVTGFSGELANWWGLKPSASGILGLPFGLLAGLLAALVLPARKLPG